MRQAPSVSEVIAFLREQPQDMKVVLVDPDTSWTLVPKFENLGDGEITISADYGDRL